MLIANQDITTEALKYLRLGLVHGLVRNDKVIEPFGSLVQSLAHKRQDGFSQFARFRQSDQRIVKGVLVGCLGEGVEIIELATELGSREFGYHGKDTVAVLVRVHGDVQGASVLYGRLEEGQQSADQILAGLHLQSQVVGESNLHE